MALFLQIKKQMNQHTIIFFTQSLEWTKIEENKNDNNTVIFNAMSKWR